MSIVERLRGRADDIADRFPAGASIDLGNRRLLRDLTDAADIMGMAAEWVLDADRLISWEGGLVDGALENAAHNEAVLAWAEEVTGRKRFEWGNDNPYPHAAEPDPAAPT